MKGFSDVLKILEILFTATGSISTTLLKTDTTGSDVFQGNFQHF